jgi:hypothetical protein
MAPKLSVVQRLFWPKAGLPGQTAVDPSCAKRALTVFSGVCLRVPPYENPVAAIFDGRRSGAIAPRCIFTQPRPDADIERRLFSLTSRASRQPLTGPPAQQINSLLGYVVVTSIPPGFSWGAVNCTGWQVKVSGAVVGAHSAAADRGGGPAHSGPSQ